MSPSFKNHAQTRILSHALSNLSSLPPSAPALSTRLGAAKAQTRDALAHTQALCERRDAVGVRAKAVDEFLAVVRLSPAERALIEGAPTASDATSADSVSVTHTASAAGDATAALPTTASASASSPSSSTEPPMSDAFFSVMVRMRRVRVECRALVGTSMQRVAVDAMDACATHMERGFETLVRWTQRHVRTQLGAKG